MTAPGARRGITRAELYDRFVITICDKAYTPLDRLRGWDSMEMIDRYCDVGTGKVNAPGSTWNRELLRAGGTVIVSDATGVVHAGPLEFGEDIGDTVVAKLNWKDGIAYLNRRLAYADPRVPADGVLSQASDDRSGYTTSVIAGYVNANIGPGALPERRLPGLAIGPDPRAGEVLTAPVQARFDNLLTLCRQLAVTGAVQFWIETSDRLHTLRLREVRDLSSDVVFSVRTHGLASASFMIAGPEATVVIVGGQGEGAGRVFAEVQSDEALAEEDVWGRFEYFRDDRSSDVDSMRAGALRDLVEKGATVTAQFTPKSTNLVYRRDYNLGDLVTGVLRPGVTVVKPIREVTTTASVSGGVRVVPIAGDYGATSSTSAQAQMRQVTETVNALKRGR